MKQKLSALVILILALTMGTTSPRTQTRVDVPQALIDRAAAGGEISVIVGVAGRFVPEGDLASADAVAQQRATIRQQVADAMSRAAAVGVAVGASFETIPFFTARVNRASLEALATTAGVTQIGEDEQMKPTLNVSPGLINAPPAWSAGHTGAGMAVAVLDTGVDTTHAFLGGRVAAQACYSNALGAGDPATSSVCPGGVNSDTAGGGPCPANVDGCNHGTHVAGIVAGDGGPSGARGIAPAASIVAVQVFSQLNSTTDCSPNPSPCTTAYTSDIIRGLQRVQALRAGGAPIAAVNMSLGGGLFPGASCDGANASINATKAAIDNLLSVGVASVVAAGNESSGGAIASPACISTAVAVGATTRGVCPGSPLCPTGAPGGLPNVPVFSNHSIAVDLLAPGVDINSSVPGGGFVALDGTSMAAPHVAGAWAVLRQAAPAASALQIVTALAVTGTSITEPFTGIAKPLINLNAARLNLLGGGGGGGLPGAPTNFIATANGNAINMSWNASLDVAAIGTAAAATNYNLIARVVNGGAPVVVLPLGNVTSFGVNAPNGTFFLSVQGTNAAGPGPESNVVQVTVPALPPPPGAPTNLTVNVVGNSASFAWTAPGSGGPVGSYALLASNAPGGAPLATLPLPAAPTTFAIGGIPPGIWYVRLIAQNSGGNSAPSNEVQLNIAGPQPPGTPTMNTPTVSAGNTVGLSWTPGAGGTPSSYNLIVRLSPAGAVFAQFALSATAVSFGGVPSGTYYLQVIANNALGSSGLSNQVILTVP